MSNSEDRRPRLSGQTGVSPVARQAGNPSALTGGTPVFHLHTGPRCTYLLPIRRNAFGETEAAELREYLSTLRAFDCEVLVIDGSPAEIFALHHDRWSDVCVHERVDPRFEYLNDKVNGIHTGVALATAAKIILADDDIRYASGDIEKICLLLDQFEVVRPQNYFSNAPLRLPWWARMEAARMLINRAALRHADYPGTCAFRKSTMLRAGEYDGDVLFDNEEIIRHFAREGARICYANDFFVRKLPPQLRKWFEQRPRQAYEDFGLRFKTILFASFLPLAVAIAFFAGIRWLALLALSIFLAMAGWLRGSARRYFPLHLCLFAPLWVAERTFSTYWAFYWFLTQGGYPFGDRVIKKGTGRDWFEGGRAAASSVPRK